MEGGADALRGEWRKDFAGWRPGIDKFLNEQDSTEVKVLSWGPGEGSPHFDKRASICADLAARPQNSVFTSEQILREEPRLQEIEDTLLAERVQADQADIIICLHVDDPKVTGVDAEVLEIRNDRRIVPKIRLLLPIVPRKGILFEATKKYLSNQTFRYNDKQYKRCIEIRAQCHKWVEAVRKQKYYAHWQERRGG